MLSAVCVNGARLGDKSRGQPFELCSGSEAILTSVRKGADAARYVDHRLLVISDEAATGSVKIKDQEYDRGDEKPRNIDWQSISLRIETARVACKSTGDGGDPE